MLKLQQLLRLYRRGRENMKGKKGLRIIKQGKRFLALLFIAAMFFSIMKLPVAYAYFYTESAVVSDGFTFCVCKDDDSLEHHASLDLFRPFLFEEDNPRAGIAAANLTDCDNVNTNAVMARGGGVSYQEHNLTVRRTETAKFVIAIAGQDFDINEIFIPSIKLCFEDKVSFALQGEIAEAALVVSFDLNEIGNWFEDEQFLHDFITLTVSGEGYREDGSIFFFTGEKSVQIKGTYDVQRIEIIGPDNLFIPKGEKFTYHFQLVDQEGSILEQGSWKLVKGLEGVLLNEKTGELTVEQIPAGESIVIEAELESQGRFHAVQKEIRLHAYPQLQILGTERITVPIQGKIIDVPYELAASPDYPVEEIAWSLAEGTAGVKVNEQGLLTVSGEAREGSFVLTALAQIMGSRFCCEKVIEVIQIDNVEIEGDRQITVPQEGSISASYTAIPYDRNGNRVDGVEISWSVEGAGGAEPVGIELDTNGLLTVTSEAEGGIVNIIASAAGKTAVAAVELSAPGPVCEEQSNSRQVICPDTYPQLQIVGAERIDIPQEGSISASYTAIPYDRNGNRVDGVEISWSIEGAGGAEPVGIELDTNGLLTVTSEAEGGIINIIASAAGKTAVAAVELSAPGPVQGGQENSGSAEGQDKEPVVNEEDDSELDVKPDEDGEDSEEQEEADGENSSEEEQEAEEAAEEVTEEDGEDSEEQEEADGENSSEEEQEAEEAAEEVVEEEDGEDSEEQGEAGGEGGIEEEQEAGEAADEAELISEEKDGNDEQLENNGAENGDGAGNDEAAEEI